MRLRVAKKIALKAARFGPRTVRRRTFLRMIRRFGATPNRLRERAKFVQEVNRCIEFWRRRYERERRCLGRNAAERDFFYTYDRMPEDPACGRERPSALGGVDHCAHAPHGEGPCPR